MIQNDLKIVKYEIEPYLKLEIWGRNKISCLLHKNSNNLNNIAESWEIVVNRNGNSIIKNGKYKGYKLKELFNNPRIRKIIFGKYKGEFPILIKYIDASKRLSLQVHPKNNNIGKSELWYVIDCKKNSKIICGLKKM